MPGLRQRDASCRRDWAAFPSGCLGKVLANEGGSVPFDDSLRLIRLFRNWNLEAGEFGI